MVEDLRTGSGVTFLQHMSVSLTDSMGSDLTVIRTAKVSTLGEMAELAGDLNPEKFIEFLMRNRHGSPFEHVVLTFLIKAPIFVWREIMRHRIASYNEESGRYRELAGEFYLCPADRKLVQVGKPGAYTFEHGSDEQRARVVNEQIWQASEAYDSYLRMLQEGIAREVARMVLPLTLMSTAYVTMNGRALMNFLSLRTTHDESMFPSFPMEEIEHVATDMEAAFQTVAPITHAAFTKWGRVAP